MKNVLKTAKNIYDFISIIFYYLSSQKSNLYLSEYYSLFTNNKYKNYFEQLDWTFSFFLTNNYNYEKNSVLELSDYWFDLFNQFNNIDFEAYCYASLMSFDKSYSSSKNNTKFKRIIKQGPLNNTLEDKVLFFNNPPESYFKKVLEKNKNRAGRNRMVYNSTDLDSKLKNFHMVKKSTIDNYEPVINRYNINFEFDDKTKIKILPCKIDFKCDLDDKKKIFSILYKSKDSNQQADSIIRIIKKADEENYSIVVFPEIFLLPDTINILQKKLCFIKLENVKLIFAGSGWKDRKNTAYILSASGTILCSHKKKIPFSYHIKEKEMDFIEDIEIDNTFEFLDIEGMGRVSYLICRDFLTDENKCFCGSIMESDMIFISAFTSKTKLMVDVSNSLAIDNGIATVLCNSSSAISINSNQNLIDKDFLLDHLLGYINYPIADGKNLKSKQEVIPIGFLNCINCDKF